MTVVTGVTSKVGRLVIAQLSQTGRGERVEQHVEADMIAVRDAGRRAQEGNPDQQVARHLLGPGQRTAEDVTADHCQHDDQEQRRGLRDADHAYPRQRPCDRAVKQFQQFFLRETSRGEGARAMARRLRRAGAQA